MKCHWQWGGPPASCCFVDGAGGGWPPRAKVLLPVAVRVLPLAGDSEWHWVVPKVPVAPRRLPGRPTASGTAASGSDTFKLNFLKPQGESSLPLAAPGPRLPGRHGTAGPLRIIMMIMMAPGRPRVTD